MKDPFSRQANPQESRPYRENLRTRRETALADLVTRCGETYTYALCTGRRLMLEMSWRTRQSELKLMHFLDIDIFKDFIEIRPFRADARHRHYYESKMTKRKMLKISCDFSNLLMNLITINSDPFISDYRPSNCQKNNNVNILPV
jgi:hypothetical protein